CVFATLPVAWIGAAQSFGRSAVVALGAAGVIIAILVWAVPRDRIMVGAAAITASAGAGVGVAAVVPAPIDVNLVFGAITAAGVAFFGIIGLIVGRNWCRGRLRVAAGWGFPSAVALAMAAPPV